MVEVGVIIGYLVTWAVRKARRAGARLDETVDDAMDLSLDRLDVLVRAKLGGHPALKELDEEAAQAPKPRAGEEGEPETGAVSELTRNQLELSLESALAKDMSFAEQLGPVLDSLGIAGKAGGSSTTMTALASGHGRVFQAGRDQHISGP